MHKFLTKTNIRRVVVTGLSENLQPKGYDVSPSSEMLDTWAYAYVTEGYVDICLRDLVMYPLSYWNIE